MRRWRFDEETFMVGWVAFCADIAVGWIGFLVWAIYTVVTWLTAQ